MKSPSLRLLAKNAHSMALDADDSISLLENEFLPLNEERDDMCCSSVQTVMERTIPRCRFAGFIEGQVKRIGSTEYRRKYLMSLQLNDMNHPLFIAEKELSSRTISTGSTTRFLIRDVEDESTVLGLLTKTGTPRDPTITYTLTHRGSKGLPVACIRYEVPSVLQVLTEGPTRRAVMEVIGPGATETKEPSSKGSGDKSLNFHGRGREASRKNMQLQNEDGRVVLQFVKWDTDVFSLDFAKPFDAFHAFAFALAQFDL